jgi:thiol-disulfide isomerase/thioredoxin
MVVKIGFQGKVVAIISVIIMGMLSGCVESEEGEDFAFTTLDGNEKHLLDYRGKVVVLDLMGANCPPCAIEMFELEKLYENYSTDEVVILSIDVWTHWGETSEDVEDFKAGFSCASPCEEENNFPNLQLQELKELYNKQEGVDLNWIFGLDDKSGSIFYEYVGEGKGVPTLCIFDQKGNLRFAHSGISVYSEIPSFLSGLSPLPPKLRPKIDELL